MEGPIIEAVSRRHIYVYGTADSPDDRGTPAPPRASYVRRELVGPALADTSLPPVVSDQEAADPKWSGANLVLFGTKETNRRIADLAGSLPIQLNAGAADYGLVFIFPAGDRYVLVNSGRPFWTGADKAKRPVFQFTPPLERTLMGFGDFILFKGSLENVVAEGSFDRSWRLPAEQAAKMAATGTVQIR